MKMIVVLHNFLFSFISVYWELTIVIDWGIVSCCLFPILNSVLFLDGLPTKAREPGLLYIIT